MLKESGASCTWWCVVYIGYGVGRAGKKYPNCTKLKLIELF